MNYKINWDNGVFAVPDNVVSCLKLASGKAVKVLLYLLKNKTEDNICENLGISEEDFEDAISYWISTDILSSDGKFRETPQAPEIEVQKTLPKKKASERTTELLPEEIAKKIEESEELKGLFEEIEKILGKSVNHREQCVIIDMTENTCLPFEVIIMIFGYCKSIDRLSVSYAEKVAYTWAEDGINTAALADAKILELQRSRTLASKCASKMFYSTRALSKKETEFVNKWSSAGADIELVMNAYNRTVDRTGKASFAYMDKILQYWFSAGIKTSEEADKYSELHKNEKKPAKKKSGDPSFDLDLIMEHAKNTPLQLETADSGKKD